MKKNFVLISLIALLLFVVSCENKKVSKVTASSNSKEQIQYASGLSILKNNGFSIVKVSKAWPDVQQEFLYILKEKNAIIPDSLKKYPTIQIPLQNIVVTSTTNIPFLELLGIEQKLIGFPHLDYISSEKTRRLIEAGKIKDIGQNEILDTEKLIDLNPDLILTFGIDNSNSTIENLQKSGLKTLIQADWMEQTPLGKAEWIKLYGALFNKEKEAKSMFNTIVKNYNEALLLVAKAKAQPTVLYGSMYQNVWYIANGESWVAQFMKDANANYLWKDSKGNASQALSIEKILEKGQNAQFWVATGSFKSIKEIQLANPHYKKFKAFQTKNIYTFESKIGAKGGTIYYELAASRPDLVLKDYIKIFHPELLPNYSFTFAKKLQ